MATGTDFERPARVLVVEDDDAISQVLQRSLRMEGYEVRVAGDGLGALDQAHAFLPDLVVLDLGLPGLDGIAMVHHIRQSFVPAVVPVVFLTGQTAPETVMAGLVAGGVAYLIKPVDLELLDAELRRALGAGR